VNVFLNRVIFTTLLKSKKDNFFWFNKMPTVKELRKIASGLKISGRSKMNKAALITAISVSRKRKSKSRKRKSRKRKSKSRKRKSKSRKRKSRKRKSRKRKKEIATRTI